MRPVTRRGVVVVGYAAAIRLVENRRTIRAKAGAALQHPLVEADNIAILLLVVPECGLRQGMIGLAKAEEATRRDDHIGNLT